MFAQEALIGEMAHLRRFAMRLTGNSPDADDLLQATVLRALENKHMFQTDTNLFKWSSKIMFNLFVSGYRRKTKFETQYDPEPYLQSQSIAPAQESIAELNAVKRAMEQLSVDHRQILILICVKGMQYEEVSEFLQIPVGTVRSRLSRAREQLQALMDSPHVDGLAGHLPTTLLAQASA